MPHEQHHFAYLMPEPIFVGYRLKSALSAEEIETRGKAYLDSLEVPPSYKGKGDKETEWYAKQKAKWLEGLEGPYVSTFDEVVISVPSRKKAVTYKSEGRAAGSKKPPICLAVRNFLLHKDMFRDVWNDGLFKGGNPLAYFVGFNPRLFLKILGIECSLPLHHNPLPLPLWYGNSDHRDIMEAVFPMPDCASLRGSWDDVVQARRVGLEPEAATAYDALTAGWQGPGVNPETDVALAMEWATQIGLIEDSKPDSE